MGSGGPTSLRSKSWNSRATLKIPMFFKAHITYANMNADGREYSLKIRSSQYGNRRRPFNA